MKLSMISAGDDASSGLLPIFTMEGKVKFYLHVNKEAPFLPKVHMPPPHKSYLWTLWGSAEPHLKTPSLGDRRPR